MKRLILAIGSLTLVAGCSHTHNLLESSGTPFVRGQFEHEQTTRLVIETLGKRYEATGFEVKSNMDWADLSRRYKGKDPKKWDRIFAGHDKSYTFYSVEATLRSADGAEMNCSMAWQSGKSHAGLCTEKSGKEYQIRFD